jgi:hypothetical protein
MRYVTTVDPKPILDWSASSDAALNAELLFQVFNAIKRVLEFVAVHNLSTQFVDVRLDPPHSGVKAVQSRINMLKPRIHLNPQLLQVIFGG